MLRVADMQRTLAFYCGALGMSVQAERTDTDGYRNVWVGYGPSATLIEFGCRPGVAPDNLGNGFDHIALEVPDVRAACAALAAKGVSIAREVKAAASGALIAIVTDPDGYRIELIQPRR
jgi:lactoylglutathione lyase